MNGSTTDRGDSFPADTECPESPHLTVEQWFARGVACMAKRCYDEAECCFRAVLATAPRSPEALLNLGYVLDRRGHEDESLRCYEMVLADAPHNAKARYNRAAHLLRSGNFRDGFADYECRFEAMAGLDDRHYDQPRWDGSSLRHRTLLVYGEQGFGDALMFVRYLPHLVRQGARIFLEVQEPLVSLFQQLPGVEQVLAKGPSPPVTDFHIPLLSLPFMFGTTPDSIPCRVPYLSPPPELSDRWRARFSPDERAVTVGLVWSGKPLPYPERSCPPEELLPLLSLAGVRFYSLHPGGLPHGSLPSGLAQNITDWGSEIRCFADSGALMVNLDLIITIDTATAHLAGALGRPVWVMLAAHADWRWQTGRSDSPWYPTMELFRQERGGEWQPVISRIAEALLHRYPEIRVTEATIDLLEPRLQEARGAVERGDHEIAIHELRDLSRLLGHLPPIPFNLGRALLGAGKLVEAEEAFTHAHQLKPDSVDILMALGEVLVRQDKLAEAFDCCRTILGLAPDNVMARYNLAFLQLHTGDYRHGFANFEIRLAIPSFAIDERTYRQPRWDGSDLSGKSLLIFCEQGLGDTIQFARYIPLIAERGAHIILELDPLLIPLLSNFPGVETIVAKSASPPDSDYHIQLLSLPHFCGTTVDTVPGQGPYLFANPIKARQWQQRLADNALCRVGLVWRGNPANIQGRGRPCPVTEFAPLAELPGVVFYSLQVGEAASEAATVAPAMTIVDVSSSLTDFTETAALIATLDLVISIDTAVAHLAGALGKPVWALLPVMADWRWLHGAEHSPWYPTMTVFEQVAGEGWCGVMGRVKDKLERLLTDRVLTSPSVAIPTRYSFGCWLTGQGKAEAGERCFRSIIGEAPELPDPHQSLGVTLQLQGKTEEAIAAYRQATDQDPSFLKAWFNRAFSCQTMGWYGEALSSTETAIALDPRHADAHWLRGALLLRQGDFSQGWQEYEWRWRSDKFLARNPVSELPLWDGSPLTGKTLLIPMEQGRGDMLQFIRYAPLAAARGGRIIVSALPELAPLLASVPGVAEVIKRGEVLPPCDLQIPVQSLPHRFATTEETIPARIPYLRPPSGYRDKWSALMAPFAGGVNVGLAWEGNREPSPERSCPLDFLTPLWSITGISFHSLQVGSSLPERLAPVLTDHTGNIGDFADTAALVENLDLVISIDTAVAHLAGALGRPTWTLLPFVADWRWLLDREDSPWYPSMTLFRQPSPGAWQPVLGQIGEALIRWRDGRRAPPLDSPLQLLLAGNIEGAERQFSALVASHPTDAEAHCNHGVALDRLGRHDEAVDRYRTALALKADYPEALFNMGNSYRSQGRPDHAARCFEQTLLLHGDFVPAHLALGQICIATRAISAALSHYQTAALLDPTSAEAYQGLGDVCLEEERFTDGITAYQRALALEPDRYNARNMMGSAFQCLGRLSEAEACYQQALALNPEGAVILNNLAGIVAAQERLDEALTLYQRLVDLHPDYAEGHWNRSLALLATGDYGAGWQEFEWRFKKGSPVPRRTFTEPRWDGTPLAGRTILLHAEQGFGDTLQFSRYAALVAERGGNVILECQVPALKRLLRSLAGVSEVYATGETLPAFDCHLPMMSLPLVFGTTITTIPATVPYLQPTPEDTARWHHRLGHSAAYKIGIVWHGRQGQVLNRKRSCPLAHFAPLAAIPHVELYSLQVGEGSEQLADPDMGFTVIDHTADFHDFSDTAAFIANLDLVITIDTAVAHLAGALGAPTWLLLPHGSDWRWLPERHVSPWYPTMSLFRKEAHTQWPELMHTVTTTLANRLKGLRVGLAWSGRQDNPLNRKRSCPFASLQPLFDLPGVTFVSLQVGEASEPTSPLVEVAEHIGDFADTAALMANLDLVISIDTSVAHLAGATGRPTWLLLSHTADWRWLTDREDSPWYPGMRLFRQPDHGDWTDVIREVAGELRTLSGFPPIHGKGKPESTVTGPSPERRMLEQQLEEHQTALLLNSSSPEQHLNVGAALALLGRNSEAEASFRSVLERDPQHVAGHLNLSYSLLAQGKYAEAWPHWEWRLRRIPNGQLPPWPFLSRENRGSHPHGTSLLVHCEQGFGDTIQFCRFLPPLAEAGYRITVSCQAPLVRLIARVTGVYDVVVHGEALPLCDLQIPLLTLPTLFATTVDSIPCSVPYLLPDPHLLDEWRERLKTFLSNGNFFLKYCATWPKR